ncbi:MAG: hypothetical protein HPM95_20220 [Alphaproteobacteria bacterium]|nr:hypothetical protein [Alphaproteobacteria bacterium]
MSAWGASPDFAAAAGSAAGLSFPEPAGADGELPLEADCAGPDAVGARTWASDAAVLSSFAGFAGSGALISGAVAAGSFAGVSADGWRAATGSTGGFT